MGWVAPPTSEGTPFENLLSWRPELRDAFRRYYSTLWDDALLPARLLELVRLRIAQIHECPAELAVRHRTSSVTDEEVAALSAWKDAKFFSDAERVALAYAEQIPWGHHGISDEHAKALKQHLSEREYVAFTIAVCLFDGVCRLKNFFELPPPDVRGSVSTPATAEGTLF